MTNIGERIAALEERIKWQHCDECGGVKPRNADDCPACLEAFGPVLVKASRDVWPVIVTLHSGETFLASGCELHGDWIVFKEDQGFCVAMGFATQVNTHIGAALAGRGLAVPLTNIAWAVDTDS